MQQPYTLQHAAAGPRRVVSVASATRPAQRRRSIALAGGGGRIRKTNSFTSVVIDFFDDLTEGARDGPRDRLVYEGDLSSDVREAAEGLQGIWADAWGSLDGAANSWSAQLSALKQELAAGTKDFNTVVDEVLDNFARDIGRLLGPLTGSNSDSASAVQRVLASAASQGSTLKKDVQQGAKTAAQAADELLDIVKAAFDDLRSLLLSSGAASAPASAASMAAEAAAAISDTLARDRPAAGVLQFDQVKEAMAALNSKMGDLTSLASRLQQQAAAGKLPASEAVEQVLTAFLDLLGLLRRPLSAAAGSASNNKALAALDRCTEQAQAGARMVREAAAKQGGVSADAAVQHLASLLQQLAADLSAELIALGPAEGAQLKINLPGGFGSAAGSSGAGGPSWRATPSQSGVQLGGSNALQELQGVLAGGVEQGLAAAGGAMKEAVAAVADFLSSLFGRIDAASANVRSGSSSLDAEIAAVLAESQKLAEALKKSLGQLPDASMAGAAVQQVDAAVAALVKRLQALQADARSNKLSSEEALQELSASVAALGSQLQASLQHRVFGSAGFTMPALPTDASRSPAAKGAAGAAGGAAAPTSGNGGAPIVPKQAQAVMMGALNSAARVLNGLLASADGNGSSGSSGSSRKAEPKAAASAAAGAAQQLVADGGKAAQQVAQQAQQAATQAADAAAQTKAAAAAGSQQLVADAGKAAEQLAQTAQQAAAQAKDAAAQTKAAAAAGSQQLVADAGKAAEQLAQTAQQAAAQAKDAAAQTKAAAAAGSQQLVADGGKAAQQVAKQAQQAAAQAKDAAAQTKAAAADAARAAESALQNVGAGVDDILSDLTGKAESLKAAVASGKADPAVVVNDAVSQLRSKAEALKKTSAGKSPDAAAAIDAAVKGFEQRAEALKSAVASGKADASLALDETLASLASKADELKQLAASSDMDNAVKELAGKLKSLKASAGSPADAAAALDGLLTDLNQKVAKSVTMLGGPNNPAAAALQAAVAPLCASAASVQAALSSPGAAASSGDIASLIDQLSAAAGDAGSSVAEGVGAAAEQMLELKAAARTLVAAEGLCGSLEGAVADLKAQMQALGSAPQGSEAAEQGANLMKATVEEVVAQLGQLKLTGLASMDDEEEGAAAAAALDKLLAAVQAKGEALAGQVQAGQMKGAAALDELLLFVKEGASGDLRTAVLEILQSKPGSDGSSSSEALAAQLEAAMQAARPAAADSLDGALAIGGVAGRLVNIVVGVAALQLVKSVSGTVLQQAGIALPSALGGMLGLTGLLMVFGPRASDEMVRFYDSHLAWTSQLLPLFYVPALAVLPVLLHGMPGDDVAVLLGITAAGAITSLLFAARAAMTFIPTAASTDAPAAPTEEEQAAATARRNAGLAVASLAALAPLALTKHDPAAYGELMAIPAGVAWSVLGWLAAKDWKASGVPGSFLLTPMVAGALSANLGVLWHGRLAGVDYLTAMHAYLGQGFGAGDLIMSLVGTALTGLAFVIYKHRASISVPAVAGTALLSSLFSVLATMGASSILGVTAGWTKSLLPRHVTDVLATDVARSMGASVSNTGLAVLLQAAMTVALGGVLFKAMGASASQAAKGAAAGCTAGAIGAAGLSEDEPVALANGGLAYAVVGVISCLVLQVPALREALVAVAATAV